jgi:hypothetical protein
MAENDSRYRGKILRTCDCASSLNVRTQYVYARMLGSLRPPLSAVQASAVSGHPCPSYHLGLSERAFFRL